MLESVLEEDISNNENIKLDEDVDNKLLEEYKTIEKNTITTEINIDTH